MTVLQEGFGIGTSVWKMGWTIDQSLHESFSWTYHHFASNSHSLLFFPLLDCNGSRGCLYRRTTLASWKAEDSYFSDIRLFNTLRSGMMVLVDVYVGDRGGDKGQRTMGEVGRCVDYFSTSNVVYNIDHIVQLILGK